MTITTDSSVYTLFITQEQIKIVILIKINIASM